MWVHDPALTELRAEPPPYLETLAVDGPAARVVDQVRLVVPALASGPRLEIDLERKVVIVPMPATAQGSAAITGLRLVIDRGRAIGRS
jgi:hypothetical protein